MALSGGSASLTALENRGNLINPHCRICRRGHAVLALSLLVSTQLTGMSYNVDLKTLLLEMLAQFLVSRVGTTYSAIEALILGRDNLNKFIFHCSTL